MFRRSFKRANRKFRFLAPDAYFLITSLIGGGTALFYDSVLFNLYKSLGNEALVFLTYTAGVYFLAYGFVLGLFLLLDPILQIKKRKNEDGPHDEEKTAEFRNEGLHREVVSLYYNNQSRNSELRQFSINIQNSEFPTTIFSTPSRIRLKIPLAKFSTSFNENSKPPIASKRLTDLKENLAKKVKDAHKKRGVRTWQQDIYRLISDPFRGDVPQLSFGLSDYFSYRFSSGLLEDETFQALIRYGGNTEKILSNRKKALPLRNELIPFLANLNNPQARISTGGIGCTVAMARKGETNDFYIPIQQRSAIVAEGPGVHTTSMQAWHQPTTLDYVEQSNLYWTVLREMFEELFNGEEVVNASNKFSHNWYLEKCPGVAFVHNNPQSITLELVGIGLNGLTGTYDCGLLLIIHDASYWDTYKYELTRNWESKGGRYLSTLKINEEITTILKQGWLDQGMFALTQAILRLYEIDPVRVAKPEFSVELI